MVKNTIAIDAMGGDNAPKSVIAGLAISSVRNPGVEYIVYGDENKLLPLLKKRDNLNIMQDMQKETKLLMVILMLLFVMVLVEILCLKRRKALLNSVANI